MTVTDAPAATGLIDIPGGMISVDDHIDLAYLPADLWTSRLPAELVERGPQVQRHDDGTCTWTCEGRGWGRWDGGAPGPPRSYQTAIERAGLVEPGVLRPTVADLRLADMTRDGIRATVMFGPVAAMDIADPQLRVACSRAYNDWLREFCAHDPARLLGVAMLTAEDPAAATAEVRRLDGQAGIVQVSMHIARVIEPIYGPAWAPFWAAVEETGLIASFHLVLLPSMLTGVNDDPASIFETSKGFITQFLDPLVGMLGRGVLERHPGVRLVLAESGLGWPPWVVQDMDYRYRRLVAMGDYWDGRGGIGLTMAPSEVFRRQVWVTFQDDQIGLDILRHFGADKVMWACDYPHPDSTFPESRQVLTRLMAEVPPDVQRAILIDNAAALYGC